MGKEVLIDYILVPIKDPFLSFRYSQEIDTEHESLTANCLRIVLGETKNINFLPCDNVFPEYLKVIWVIYDVEFEFLCSLNGAWSQ